MDFETGPIIFIANNQERFFSEKFLEEKYVRRFIAPLSSSGQVMYMGHPQVRKEHDKLRKYNADQFFGVLDESWAQLHVKLCRRLDINIPLFLSIVLSRSKGRDDIPCELLNLREEFSNARRQLWELFDEADFRIYDTSVAARVLNDIENQAAAVIPNSLKSHDFHQPIFFDLLGRFTVFDALGAIGTVTDYISNFTIKQLSRIDAAYLTENALRSVELKGLIGKFLSDEELQGLRD